MSDRIDLKKERLCSYLLPDPGGEVVRRLVHVIGRLQAENERLREFVRDFDELCTSGAPITLMSDIGKLAQRARSIITSKEQES